MSRGTMYHITTDEWALGGMCAEDFQEHLESLACDYVEDQDPEDAGRELESLKSTLAGVGFGILDNPEDLPEDCAFAFSTGSESELKARQIAYFAGTFEELKKYVTKTTPEQFSCDTSAAYRIQELAADPFGDAAYVDLGTGPSAYGLMAAVRNLLPDRVYYVDKATVYMH